jgi:hypothetical protein
MMSHQLTFMSPDLATKWNGHWSYPEWLWKMMAGRRPFFMNREPCSAHVALMQKHGFRITCLLKQQRLAGITRAELSQRWKNLSDDDLACSGAFIQAVSSGAS